jgi:hypothetical protein
LPIPEASKTAGRGAGKITTTESTQSGSRNQSPSGTIGVAVSRPPKTASVGRRNWRNICRRGFRRFCPLVGKTNMEGLSRKLDSRRHRSGNIPMDLSRASPAVAGRKNRRMPPGSSGCVENGPAAALRLAYRPTWGMRTRRALPTGYFDSNNAQRISIPPHLPPNRLDPEPSRIDAGIGRLAQRASRFDSGRRRFDR